MTTTMATNGKHNYQAKFNDRALGLGSKFTSTHHPTCHLPLRRALTVPPHRASSHCAVVHATGVHATGVHATGVHATGVHDTGVHVPCDGVSMHSTLGKLCL